MRRLKLVGIILWVVSYMLPVRGGVVLPTPYGNYAPDWNFETMTETSNNIGEWYNADNHLSVTESEALLGAKSMMINPAISSSAYMHVVNVYPVINSVPLLNILRDQHIRIAVWVKSDADVDVTLKYYCFNINGVIHETLVESTVLHATAEWQQVALYVDVPYHPITMGFELRVEESVITYLDCFSIELVDNKPLFNQNISFPNGNMIDNWDFEDFSDDGTVPQWTTTTNTSVDLIDGKGYTGKNAVQLTPVASGAVQLTTDFSDAGSQLNRTSFYKLLGQDVILSVYVKPFTSGLTNEDVILGLNSYNNTTTVATGEWTRIVLPVAGVSSMVDGSDNVIRCFVSADVDSMYVDGVVLEFSEAAVPVPLKVVTNYTAATGNVMQTQIRNGNKDIVTLTGYDALGRNVANSVISEFDNTEHTFMYGAWGMLAGQYADISGGFPYNSTEYSDDPTNRIEAAYAAGTEGAGHPVTYAYGNNQSTDPGAVGAFFEKTITDENGVVSKEWTDKAGNIRGTCSDYGEDGLNLLALNEFDIRGNVTKQLHPNYFDETIPSYGSYVTEYRYDRDGNRITGENPDMISTVDDETDIDLHPDESTVYDLNGNPLFSTNVKKAGEGYFTAFAYDVYGRITGTYIVDEADLTWGSVTRSSAIPANASCKIRMQYDTEPDWTVAPWNTVTPEEHAALAAFSNVRGRLAATAYTGEMNGSGTVWGMDFYAYDEYGNITSLCKKLPGMDGGIQKITYEYDYEHKLVSHSLVNMNSAPLTCINSYDALGRISGVVIPGYTGNYCEYTYTPDGQVDKLVFNDYQGNMVQTVDYTYDIRSRIVKINDQELVGTAGYSFAEDITYSGPAYTQNDGSASATIYGNQISKTEYKSVKTDGSIDHYAFQYGYDDAYRLLMGDYTDAGNGWTPGDGYYDLFGMTYSPDGSILSLSRRGDGDGMADKDYTYEYYLGTHRLRNLAGNASLNDYRYDDNGNMVADIGKSIGNATTAGMAYDYRNLPVSVEWDNASRGMKFIYDHSGNRVVKQYYE